MLVLRPGALGDALLAVPALRALRRTFGSVTFASNAAAARLLERVGEVDRSLAFDDPSLASVVAGTAPLDQLVVAWMSAIPNAALVAPSRPTQIEHCAEYLLRTLAPLGIDLTFDGAAMRVTPIASKEVLVHPGSGSPSKNWSSARFAEVIRRLGNPVRLVVGEADREAAAAIEAALGRKLPRVEHPPLETLAARLAGCHAYVGNDSGVSHLAGLCGARTVVMFGASDPRIWRPIGPDVHVFAFDTDAAEVAAQLVR